MKKIAVLKGGFSPERDVSLVSGSEVAKELLNLGYKVLEFDPVDFENFSELVAALRVAESEAVFIALHGGSGENGELQAALSLAGIPFTGSGSKACALSMDKFITKLIAQSEGIPVPEALIFREKLLDEYQDIKDFDAIGARLALPLVVKPNDAGSSVGISIVHRMEDLKSAVSEAFKYSNSVLLEQFIPGRELTVTVLAGEALPVVEIAPKNGWYDYKSKYTKGTTDYTAPALIDEAEALLLQVYAVRLWKALECEGYARFDFRYDGQRSYFLEVNTLPGMTPLSLTPMAAKAQGFTFGELLDKIIKEVRTDIKWRKP